MIGPYQESVVWRIYIKHFRKVRWHIVNKHFTKHLVQVLFVLLNKYMAYIVGSPPKGNSEKPVRFSLRTGKMSGVGQGGATRKSPQSKTAGPAKVSVLFPGNGFKSVVIIMHHFNPQQFSANNIQQVFSPLNVFTSIIFENHCSHFSLCYTKILVVKNINTIGLKLFGTRNRKQSLGLQVCRKKIKIY